MFDETASVEVFRVGENEFFGESALISNDPQSTTARATEDCDLLAFARDSVRDCIVDNLNVVPVLLRFLRARMLEQLVRTSPLFAHLDTAERRALGRKFEFIEVSDGALLIRQGACSPGLFVLLSGAVDVIRCDGDREQWLATLERGGMFGEISLLSGSVAEADVRSATAGFALMLPAAVFRDVIMSHPPLLEVLSVMSEERTRANQRRLRPESRSGAGAPR
jgi:CRP-like cAMP-binding protein